MRLAVIQNGREIPKDQHKAVLLDASQRFRDRQRDRLDRRVKRLSHHPERLSVAKAMFAVEQRIVEALWTLARLPNDKGVGFSASHGISYLQERADLYANAVANGGWLSTPPRPAPPSARSIDAMHEPLEWLRWLDRDQAKIVTAGATQRRGDMGRNISWNRVKLHMPELGGLTARTLQRRYEQAIRDIVAQLTEAKLG